MNRFLLALIVSFWCAALAAVVTENSASANALSGITLLSESVSDYALSPIVGSTGICATWYRPFGNADTGVYGLHSAFLMHNIVVATGINYLDNPDYRWQDEYLSLSLNYSSLALGASQHLAYEKIGEDSWYKWDNDYGAKISSKTAAAELRYLRARSDDASLVLSASTQLNPSSSVCSAYTWRKRDKGSYAFATSYQIASPLVLQSSWQSEPARFGMGLKVIVGKLAVMYGIRSHPELSLTHCLDLEATW